MLEFLSGRLQMPDFERDPSPYLNTQFLFAEWESLSPYDEARADVVLLNAGIRSRAEIVASRGRDISDVDREFASDNFIPRGTPPNQQIGDSNAP
jgi:capsid protein